jgi:hypothetical protein
LTANCHPKSGLKRKILGCKLVPAKAGIALPDLPRFEQMAAFRNLLVHYYERIDDAVVFGIFKRNLKDFDRFVDCLIDYLERLPEREPSTRGHYGGADG